MDRLSGKTRSITKTVMMVAFFWKKNKNEEIRKPQTKVKI